MLTFRPRLNGAALLIWLAGLVAFVVALGIWLFSYEEHGRLAVPLVMIGLMFSAWSRLLDRRSSTRP